MKAGRPCGFIAVRASKRTRGSYRGWGYPDGLSTPDLNQPRVDRYGLPKKKKGTTERVLRRTIVGAGLHSTFRRLGLTEYPTFEYFIDVMASMAYKLRPNDDYFVQNPEKVKDHWPAVTPALTRRSSKRVKMGLAHLG